MIRAPDVETCREEKINANLLSKFQLLPAEVNETEPGESSCPGGSECVAKGGRGYFRPSYGQPKFTLFSKKEEANFRRHKKMYLPQFSNLSFQT